MSYTTLYKVPESGGIEEYCDFKNAFLGGFNIWSEMAKYYLNINDLPIGGDMQLIWDLHKQSNVLPCERVVMASTFDRVMVRKENMLLVAESIDGYCTRFDPGHLPQQAEKIRELALDESCFAICWNQTSVSQNWPEVETGDGWYDYRAYDVSIDSDHWFMFQKVELRPMY